MKNFVAVFLFLLAVNVLVPVAYRKLYPINGENNYITPTATPRPQADLPPQSSEKVILYDNAGGEFLQLDLKDYLIGAAACEMPALYEEQALKAQMIAIHSYYKYCRENPDYLENGYITVDSSKLSGYRDKTKLMEFWGMNFYDYYAKFTRCADEVANMTLTYNGQTALTPYFAVSRGKTANSREVWGRSLEYLVSADSSFDGISDDYMQIKEYKTNEMYAILKSTFPGLGIKEWEPEEWFGEIVYYDSGYAEHITIDGDKISGEEFRKALNLPSSCVMVFYEDEVFSIATKGYGHGVGLSQFGANQLSQQGYSYKEILAHYYPGTTINTI